MKKNILILLIAVSFGAFAQQNPPTATTTPAAPASPASPPTPPTPPQPPRKEKIEAMRIGFITQKLDLTSDEAQEFWPVYNDFQKKKDEMQKKKREDKRNMKANLDSLTEKQIESMVDAEMIFRQKSLDLEKEYHGKFKSVLPIKKVAKLYRAEEQFTHRLLDQISDRGKKGGAQGGKRDAMAPPPAATDTE